MSELNLDQINPEENLARYILQKNQFSSVNQRVKYSTFMPAPNGETSVFRISTLSTNEIWKIGDSEVAQKRGLHLLARADIAASHIIKVNLKIIPDNIPPRHANIVGWPEEKSARMSIALELAKNAQLHLK